MNPDKLKILVASGNKHKVRELQTVAREFSLQLVSPQDWSEGRNLAPIPVVEEPADTYHENALIKARAYSAWAGIPALGDDSGLEVLALDGRPGVLSARYAGVDASDQMRGEKLLAELAALERLNPQLDRSAAYVCHLALTFPDGRELFADARLCGRILHRPVTGAAGFGYDPIVFIDDLGKTFAEVDFSVTCSKGFRALAAKKLFTQLALQKC